MTIHNNSKPSTPWCKSKLCSVTCSQIADRNGRGFCCGTLRRPYARTHRRDIIKFCFVDTDKNHYKLTGYVMTPAEAVLCASALAWTYEEHMSSLNSTRLKKTPNIAANLEGTQDGQSTRQPS